MHFEQSIYIKWPGYPLMLRLFLDVYKRQIESSNANIVEATGITVDGTFLGAVKNGAAISDRLNKMLDKYKTNKPGAVSYTHLLISLAKSTEFWPSTLINNRCV